MAPPSTTKSRPGRALATLLVLIVALLLAIVGKNITSPGDWQHDFKVQLGLDLSSGTTVTLRADTPTGQSPTASDMATAISIMESRVNHAGFSGATVQQQGTNIITVSVPGKGSTEVVNLVGTTAQLRFRQVLLLAPNTSLPGASNPTAPAPTPDALGQRQRQGEGEGQGVAEGLAQGQRADPGPRGQPDRREGLAVVQPLAVGQPVTLGQPVIVGQRPAGVQRGQACAVHGG